jgi:hypothetical protein
MGAGFVQQSKLQRLLTVPVVSTCRRQEQQEAQHRSNQQQLARKAAAAEVVRLEDAAFK